MSRVSAKWFGCLCAAASICAVPAYAQYPGHVNEGQQQNETHLRATGVLEFTGTLAHPTATRLIPIAVWDGTAYQPGGLYLADPAPLAVQTGTQYILETAGQPKGFFDISEAEDLGGAWIGVGKYQAPPVVVRRPNSTHMPRVVQDYDPDKPHFAHVPPPDNTGSASVSTAPSAPPVDPNRPTLHERPAGSSGTNSTQASSPVDVDPDRPTLHETRPANTVASAAAAQPDVDPNRPRLDYGKPAEEEKLDKPDALVGIPEDMNQMAGISDVRTGDTESYVYSWANPDDENKMKADLELIAEKAVAPPPPATDTTASRHNTHHRTGRPQAPKLPMLTDEEFSAFGLSFGGGATMVFSARTVSTPVQYVTIIAQPDFYGKPQVLLQRVATQGRLDVTPRMRLVDAVDTEGDGRADLIFELRGQTWRQFAIYRISGGAATQAFLTQPTAVQ